MQRAPTLGRISYTGVDIVQPLVDGLQRAFGTPTQRHAHGSAPLIRFMRFDISLQARARTPHPVRLG